MSIPLQITTRHFEPSPALNEAIRAELDSLEPLVPRAVSCHVVVEQPHHHHSQGRHFQIRVHLAIPGEVEVANRDPEGAHAHEDAFVAVREAFEAVRRQALKHEKSKIARRRHE